MPRAGRPPKPAVDRFFAIAYYYATRDETNARRNARRREARRIAREAKEVA